MKRIIKANFNILAFIMLAILLSITFLPILPSHKANATDDLFVNEIISDENFSLTMTANARKKNGTLSRIEKTVKNSVEDEITFLSFNWRELESLKFVFSSSITTSTKQFKHIKFQVTHLQVDADIEGKLETLDSSLGVDDPDPALLEMDIFSNNFQNQEYFYNIDSDSKVSESFSRSNGHDFGLYKFDFIYTYLEDGEEIEISLGSGSPTYQGGLYVAVLPDKPETIDDNKVKILYSISSSNKLLNVFNLYLSNDSYKYINPSNIQWNVVGSDIEGINYVLTKKIQQSNPQEYSNHRFIYENLYNNEGKSFIFDSKDIEGKWTAYCTITNSDGSIKHTLQVENLSTIKLEKKSYFWLIFGIVAGCLVLALVITIIIVKRKKEKVW